MLGAVTRGLRAHGAIWPHVVQADRHEVSVGLVRAGGSITEHIRRKEAVLAEDIWRRQQSLSGLCLVPKHCGLGRELTMHPPWEMCSKTQLPTRTTDQMYEWGHACCNK